MESTSVQAYRRIENSIILNLTPNTMAMLKEVAIEHGQSGQTYSDTVTFLVKYFFDSQKKAPHKYKDDDKDKDDDPQ